MKKLVKVVGLAALFLMAHGLSQAWADDPVVVDEPAVVNDAPNAWAELKAAVDILEPTVEAIYDVEAEEWVVGSAGSLYDFTSSSVYLGRIKAGYASSNVAYTGVDVDLPGLSARYLEGRWAQLDRVLQAVSKYAQVGYMVGFNTEADQISHGPTFGATLRF